jgi:LETM1-like protein.
MLSSKVSSLIRISNSCRAQNDFHFNLNPVTSSILSNSFHISRSTNSCLVIVRHLHIGHRLHDKEPLKPSSKVEETVQALKEDLKDKPAVAVATEKPPLLKRITKKVVDELVHYYHGFRLLFIDINVSRKFVWKVLNGKSLTRREHRLVI